MAWMLPAALPLLQAKQRHFRMLTRVDAMVRAREGGQGGEAYRVALFLVSQQLEPANNVPGRIVLHASGCTDIAVWRCQAKALPDRLELLRLQVCPLSQSRAFEVLGSGFWVRVQGSGCRGQGPVSRVQG